MVTTRETQIFEDWDLSPDEIRAATVVWRKAQKPSAVDRRKALDKLGAAIDSLVEVVLSTPHGVPDVSALIAALQTTRRSTTWRAALHRGVLATQAGSAASLNANAARNRMIKATHSAWKRSAPGPNDWGELIQRTKDTPGSRGRPSGTVDQPTRLLLHYIKHIRPDAGSAIPRIAAAILTVSGAKRQSDWQSLVKGLRQACVRLRILPCSSVAQ